MGSGCSEPWSKDKSASPKAKTSPTTRPVATSQTEAATLIAPRILFSSAASSAGPRFAFGALLQDIWSLDVLEHSLSYLVQTE